MRVYDYRNIVLGERKIPILNGLKKTLKKMEYLLLTIKYSIFYNVFNSVLLLRHQRVYLWSWELTLLVLNFIMDCSNFEIWPVYMNLLGIFPLFFIYNRVDLWSEGSFRSLLIWVYTDCKFCMNLVPALQGLMGFGCI